MASNTSTTASLGGAVQRSLGAGCVMMVVRSLDMLSVVVVASTTCLARLILWFCPEDDGFEYVRWRRLLEQVHRCR